MAAESQWDADGLPEECPECGEREDLAADIHRFTEQMHAAAATVMCFECGHEWHWGRRMEGE